MPIWATRPYRGPADAGPKGVSQGSAIGTRTPSCKGYRAVLGPAACRRKQDSHAREIHEVVTASGARLVIRGERPAGRETAKFGILRVTPGNLWMNCG